VNHGHLDVTWGSIIILLISLNAKSATSHARSHINWAISLIVMKNTLNNTDMGRNLKQCSSCLISFTPDTIARHREICSIRYCECCKTKYPKTTKHVCRYSKCPYCRKKYLKISKHDCLYSWCTRCKKKYLKTDAHNCVPTRKECQTCLKFVDLVDLETHDCQKRKSCTKCLKIWPIDEFDRYDCNKYRCPHCRKMVLRSDNHNCGMKLCRGCQKVFPADELESHYPNCYIQEKRALGLCTGTVGCQEPMQSTSVFCARHLGKFT